MITRRLFCQSSLLALLGAMGLSGCQPTSTRTSRLNIQYERNDAPFPVTIQHALGQTVIRRQPEKVVILGMQTPDIAFELGVIPVAIEANFWGGDGEGFLPWYKQAIEKSGKLLPELINMYPEPDVEKLMALQTDLILAPQSGLTAPLFQQLSAIAPVVAYPERAWLTSIDEMIQISAAALGRQPEAIQLTQKIQQYSQQIKQNYPQFQRYNFAYIYAGGRQGQLSVYQKGDARVEGLVNLGLQLSPVVADLPMRMGAFMSELGLENADKLNEVDIVITWFSSEQERDAMLKRPLYAQIPAIRRGSAILLTDKSLITAMSYGTPLALQWGLPTFLPLLQGAIGKVG